MDISAASLIVDELKSDSINNTVDYSDGPTKKLTKVDLITQRLYPKDEVEVNDDVHSDDADHVLSFNERLQRTISRKERKN